MGAIKKSIIYGAGRYYHLNKERLPDDIEIIAFADSDENKATSHSGKLKDGKEILTVHEMQEREYDLIFICTDYYYSNRIFDMFKKLDIDLRKVRFLNRIGIFINGWSYDVQDDKSLISTIEGVRVKEEHLTDSDILAEVFVSNNYNIHLPKRDSIVIDVGMNVGIVSLYFARYEWVSKVYSFEPFPDTYQQALENFELNDKFIKDKIYPQNIALSNKNEEMEISVNAEESGWRNIFSRKEVEKQVKIVIRDAASEIEKILKENQGKQIILKIDVEGSEFDIFESLAHIDMLRNVDAVMMEYHREPEILCKRLSACGFKYFVIGEKTLGMIYAVK